MLQLNVTVPQYMYWCATRWVCVSVNVCMCVWGGWKGTSLFHNKKEKAMHVYCLRSLHVKQADEKRSLRLHWGSVIQLSIYIKAHYVWRTPQLFSANLIRRLTLTPCLCGTEDDRRFVGVITNGEQTVASCGCECVCALLDFFFFFSVERTSMARIQMELMRI